MDEEIKNLKDRVKKIAEEGTSSEEWQEVRAFATDLAKDAAEAVRKHPVPAVLGAAAVGFALGVLLGRRK